MRSSSPLRAVSVVDALVNELRELVLRGELAQGEKVSEAALAERFHVARPSIRAALQALVQAGLLYREPNRSVHVPLLGAEDVRDLFTVRTLLEVDAVRALASRGIQPAPALRAVRQLEVLSDDEGWHEVVAHDLALHQALVDGVGSPRMSRIYAGITDEIRLCIAQLRSSYDSPRQIAAEHRELIDEVYSGDVDRAVAACRAHLDASERILLTGHR